jgi:putative SOS response-associated peptidase YedK
VDQLDRRKLVEGEITCDLSGFLTTEPNREVAAVHPKAMPVILTVAEEIEAWLTAPWSEACQLQRPLPNNELCVVARGERKDEAPAFAA